MTFYARLGFKYIYSVNEPPRAIKVCTVYTIRAYSIQERYMVLFKGYVHYFIFVTMARHTEVVENLGTEGERCISLVYNIDISIQCG